MKMALDNCSILPESEILNNGSREEGNHGFPNQNDMASSDSDSGNSIFLTQAETPTPPLRKVRRNRARSQSHPLYLCEESSDSESDETSAFFELHSKTDSWRPSSCRDKPHSREASVRKRKIHFPFLQKYHRKFRLTSLQRQTLVNSSIGGFFQCMKSLSLTEKSKTPEYQDPLSDLSGLEEETEEHKDNQEDIRVVDGALFVQDFHKRNRQEWGSNTRKSPSEVRKMKKKLSNAKDVSKGLKIGPEIKQTQLRRSRRHPAKENSTQNLAGHRSSPCSENGKEKRVNDKSCCTQVLETSQASPNYKAPSHVTSQASNVFDTEDERHVVIAEQTENDQTDIEVSFLQTQSLSLESHSVPQPKTQFQPAMESAVPSSQGCELQTVDDDSISLLGTAKKKKKDKMDCLESPAVDVCSVPRKSISISQDTMLSPDTMHNPPHVTSQAWDVSVTEDELYVAIAEQTENDQTDIEVSILQTQSLSLESHSVPKPKTQFQPAMESAVPSSQGCELQTVDDDSISLLGTAKKKKKKKKKNKDKMDCLESPAVDVCSVPRENISISQDTMLSPAPAPETEIEMLSQRKKKKKKHESKENPCDVEDPVHQESQEQINSDPPEGQRDQLRERKKRKKKTYDALEKTQIQPAMESAVPSSQDCELQTVDGDSNSLLGTAKKKKKKKKKNKDKMDCLESPAVDVCSVPRENISISQDTMLSPAPAPAPEIEMLSQRKKKKKKHESKENPCDVEDPVQQESQEQINSDPPEGQRDQLRERKKRKKKTYDALECEQTTSDPKALSPVEKARDKQLLSSEVCEVPSCDDNSVMLNSSTKKKKKTKERKEDDVESRTVEELNSLKDANSFSQEYLVTSVQEVVHRKRMKKISDGPDGGEKRKRKISDGNICSTTNPEAQMWSPKKKKKRHKSGNPCSLEAIRSEDNCSHDLRELGTSKTTCQSACSFETDPAPVHSDTPEGQKVQLRDGPNNKEKGKRKKKDVRKKVTLDSNAMDVSERTGTSRTVDVDLEENMCLSLVGKKRSDIDTSQTVDVDPLLLSSHIPSGLTPPPQKKKKKKKKKVIEECPDLSKSKYMLS